MKKILSFLPFSIGIVLILFFWKNTILHITTQTHDWYDGAFIIWTIQNNIKHFKLLDFTHLFETNAMYPFPNSLSFTDHLFIPSLFALIIAFFSPNPLLQFNIVSIANHLLVFFSFYLLASRFTKNNWIKLIGALYGALGPYFFSQFNHLQMIFIWSLALSLYYLFEPERKLKHLILTGFFLGLQFLTGVYVGLMGLSMLGLYYFSQIIVFVIPTKVGIHYSGFRIKSGTTQMAKEFIIILITFLLVSSVSIYEYILVNIQYHPQRDQGEFVTYAAHITDYLLVMSNNSWFNKHIFIPTVGSLNKHYRGEMAIFVGFIPLIVIFYVILNSFQDLKRRKMLKKFQHDKSILIWLVFMALMGFVFSLGPRMNWNGRYLVTPLPYWLVMKVFPPITIMRAVARWYLLVFFSVFIAFIFSLNKLETFIKNKTVRKFVFPIILILFLIEFYPASVSVSSREWITPVYLYLQNACKDHPGAVLEYPFEYQYKFDDVRKYLSLKTNTLMSSTLHDCPTLSGFSSFEPPLFKVWQSDFDTNGITDSNIKILKVNKFAFIKINLEALSEKERKNPESVIHTTQLKEVFKDNYSILYKITY